MPSWFTWTLITLYSKAKLSLLDWQTEIRHSATEFQTCLVRQGHVCVSRPPPQEVAISGLPVIRESTQFPPLATHTRDTAGPGCGLLGDSMCVRVCACVCLLSLAMQRKLQHSDDSSSMWHRSYRTKCSFPLQKIYIQIHGYHWFVIRLSQWFPHWGKRTPSVTNQDI
jgi:hypothetical protein